MGPPAVSAIVASSVVPGSLAGPLVSAVLPVLSIAGVGYAFATYQDVDAEPLSVISLYVLLPALVFHSLATTEIPTDVAVTAFLGVYGFVFVMLVVAEAVCYLFGVSGTMRNALVLTAMFPNVGNYGLPLADFAFGSIGREIAVIFIIAQSTLMYSLGVFIASRRSDRTWKGAFSRIFQLPVIYAVIVALLLRALGRVPSSGHAMMEAIAMTGNATIPIMLLLLGMKLAGLRRGASFGRIFQASALVLVVSPVVALGFALLLALPAAVMRPFVLLGAMPTAITPLLLLIEFGDPSSNHDVEYASSVIFLTTILSIGTLSLIIVLLS
ncbi:AEC family transporter [Halorubrum sp. CBA1125]|nr:AEC family transporter [Halorubrum sp. CBA1125]